MTAEGRIDAIRGRRAFCRTLGTLCVRSAWLGGLVSLAGCGYAVGNGFPPEIRTIAVPIFTSKSFRRNIEFQLTEAVQKQVQQRTPYRLVSEEDADTRLVGKIIDMRKSVVGETQNDDARTLRIAFVVDVKWEDLRNHGKILGQTEVEMTPAEANFISQADFSPEVGQSLATAYQQAIDRMARHIVNMMETPW